MKRFVLAAAALTALAGAASAYTAEGLTTAETNQVERLVPGVNVDSLSAAQINAIQEVLSQDVDHPAAEIRSIVY